MSTTTFKQNGFGAIALVAVVLVLGAIGFTGYKVISNAPAAEQSATTPQTTAPATLKTTADLESTSQELEKSNTQLDSDLNDSSLDADVNSML